eukprot:g33729.t1
MMRQVLAQMRSLKGQAGSTSSTTTLLDFLVRQAEKSEPGELANLFGDVGEAFIFLVASISVWAEKNIAQAQELARTAASGDQELATRGKSTEERTSFGLCEKWAETCTIGRPKLENSTPCSSFLWKQGKIIGTCASGFTKDLERSHGLLMSSSATGTLSSRLRAQSCALLLRITNSSCPAGCASCIRRALWWEDKAAQSC